MIEAVTDDLVFALRLADLADEITNTGFHARGAVLPPEGLLGGWRDQAVRRAACYLSHHGPPGHGPLLVAAGEIEVSVFLAGGPWDHAPFVVLVEEAGGEFSNLWGSRRIDTATAVYSNRLVHRDVRAEVMAAAPDRPPPDDAP